MDQQPPLPGRRRFCIGLATVVAASAVLSLTACNNFQPRPFVTGDPVAAPRGCTEMRQRDPRGDC